MASTDRQRWARVPPALAWKHPGLPTLWTHVLERNSEAMSPEPLPGYVWIDAPGKVLGVVIAVDRLHDASQPTANWDD